jgi:EmrB/QacA subfamily drug resistance transporter
MSSPSVEVEDPHFAHRWLILGVIAIAQLLVILDATIVNIALPSAQADLGFSNNSRQWVITAYALAFGSLLLLGGRVADLFGRKRAFITGLIGFAAASGLGGAAPNFGTLITARALQGAFGALLAPAALSLLATTFLDPKERAKAFGIFGAIAGAGGAVGLLLGGVLTEWLDWRWCLYVALVFALPAAAAATRLLHPPAAGVRPKLDLLGTGLATTGLLALVYGFARAETEGWSDGITLFMFVACVVLLSSFVVWQRRAPQPLLPIRIIVDRDRAASYLGMLIGGVGIFGVFLFITFYMQSEETLGFSPVMTGVAFMPLNLSVVTTAVLVSTRVLAKTGPRPLMPLGMLFAAAAMGWFTQLEPHSSYAAHILPSLIALGIGMGLIFAPAFVGATSGVAPQDSGVASAMVNTSQQVGGAIGTALLSTIAASAGSSYLDGHAGAITAAQVHGYTVAFGVSAGIFVLGSIITASLLRSGVPASLLQRGHGADTDAVPAVAH